MTQRSPQLSCVVLAWDNLDLTRACVESLRANTDVDFEIIIVDNGSAPDAAAYAKDAADVAVLHDTNRGFACGMNAGLAVATGTYVAFCNNDTTVPARWASTLLDTAEAQTGFGIVVPVVTEAGNETNRRSAAGTDVVVLDPFCQPPSAVLYLLDRQTALDIGGFCEDYPVASGEDIDLAFSLWCNGRSIVVDERVLVDHVGKATANRLDDWPSRWESNREIFFERWLGDGAIVQLPGTADDVFAANRAVARAVVGWMQRFFKARYRIQTLERDRRSTRARLSALRRRAVAARPGGVRRS